MKLTDTVCKKAKPDSRDYKLRDGKGLYLLVMKAGGKSWRYDYKLKTGDPACPENVNAHLCAPYRIGIGRMERV